jgi:hypothetical protein
VLKVNRFSFVCGSFKPVVHKIENLIKTPLGKHEALSALKFNQVGVDRQRYNSSGPPFTPGVVRGHDKLTKRQVVLPAIGFHEPRINGQPARRYWGFPRCEIGCSTGFKSRIETLTA